MANFLTQAAQALAGILNPRKRNGVADVPASGWQPTETPVYQPEPKVSPKPIGIDGAPFMNDPQIQKLFGEIDSAKGVLNRPAPELKSAKIDPLESVLSVFLAGANPYAAGKTLEVPNQLAHQRADAANAGIAADYNLSRETAQNTINTNTKLIDMALDRDAISERVSGTLKAKEMETVSKREIAQLNQNGQMIRTLANLEATGGITVPAVAAIYQQMGYDFDQANAIASNVVAQIEKDPSIKVRIQQAKQETEQLKAQESSKKDHRKMLTNPNATYEDRLNSMMALADAGDPLFAGMTYEQLQNAAMAKGSVTAKNEAQTKTEGARYEKLVADTGVSEARAKKIEKETALMDEQSAATVAKAWAYVDDIRSRISDRGADRELAYRKLSTEQLIRSKDGMSTALQTLSTQANTLRTRLKTRYQDLAKAADDTEKKEIQDDIHGIEKAIGDYKKQYGEIKDEMMRVSKGLGEMSHETTVQGMESKPLPNGNIGVGPEGTTKKYMSDKEKRRIFKGGSTKPVTLPKGVTR